MATELPNMLLTKTQRTTASWHSCRAMGARRYQEGFKRRRCS